MSGAPRKSLVDYSKISDRPVQDARFASHQPARGPALPPAAAVAPPPDAAPKRSAQMDAVMRLMTGQQERTIAEKLADANRPTWEQYKKDNQDKLNLDEGDQKEMEAYRKHLDDQRDKLLAARKGGGSSKSKKKKRKKKKKRRHDDSESDSSSSDSESTRSSSEDRKRRRKHKKKKKKRRRHDDESDYSSDYSDRKRRKHKKKHKKKRDDGEESDGSHYKLSKFFTEDS